MALLSYGRKRKGGRRRNYEPAPTGMKAKLSILPVGWVNWVGFVLFGLLSIALVVQIATALADGRDADAVAALVVGSACGWLTYLFATTPFRNEDELAEAVPIKRSSRN